MNKSSMRQTITECIEGVERKCFAVLSALRASPAFSETNDTLELRSSGFEIHINRATRNRLVKESLQRVNSFALIAAPECVDEMPLLDNDSILVLRHRTPLDENLLPARATQFPFKYAARRQFRRDMEVLAEHGMVHPYLRGLAHMLVGETSGTLFATDWQVAEPADERTRTEFIDKIDVQMREHAKDALAVEHVFHAPRVLLPVIHPETEATAMASVEVAIEARCGGIFLINQGMSTDEVLQLVMTVRRKHPYLWVGINLLGMSPSQVLERSLAACKGRIDGIWSDNARIDEQADSQPEADEFVATRKKHSWQGLYFGGVAFKYQREVAPDQLGRAASVAMPYMDLVCTSGPGTAQHADVTKIAAMREGLGDKGLLAIASGVTPENIDTYLPHADAFLVGTGIEKSFGVLDLDKTRQLQLKLDAWCEAHQTF